MARRLRCKSAVGCYHLILRGNNKQILFETPDDYRFFLSRMGKYCRESDIRISAYCLMENHVHLLVKDPQDTVPAMMQKLTLSYSFYYNQKYGRTGHLFQGRYLSEPVDNDLYLLTVFRYILNNPRKAGICPAKDYRWSSYRGYFRPSSALDMDFIREQFPTAESYRKYIDTDNEDECLEYTPGLHDDAWARNILLNCLNVSSGTELQAWEKEKRDGALLFLKEKGLSLRQIERLTGISRGIVQRAG